MVVVPRRIIMLSKTAIALVAASFALGFAALTPAVANYDRCYENPAATGCPGNYEINQSNMNAPVNAHRHRGAEHQEPMTTRHHG
jgi:hypothetical protein